jgi:hypothetical protein
MAKKKIKNPKNKDLNWNINNQEGQVVIFKGEKRKEKEKSSSTTN